MGVMALASYAMDVRRTRGRRYPETASILIATIMRATAIA